MKEFISQMLVLPTWKPNNQQDWFFLLLWIRALFCDPVQFQDIVRLQCRLPPKGTVDCSKQGSMFCRLLGGEGWRRQQNVFSKSCCWLSYQLWQWSLVNRAVRLVCLLPGHCMERNKDGKQQKWVSAFTLLWFHLFVLGQEWDFM